MKLRSLFPLAAIAGLLLTSCASVAHVEKDETVNFSKYRTYAWAEPKANDSVKTSRVSDLTETKIRQAVDAELAKQGWKAVKHNPDVLMAYDVLVERSTRQDRDPVYTQPMTRWFFNPYTRRYVPVYYPSQFLGYDVMERGVREGTLTLSIIDARSEKTVWQGWTTDEVNSSQLTQKEIAAGVKSIFKKFDIAKN